MASPFAFVPRKVAKSANLKVSSSITAPPLPVVTPGNTTSQPAVFTATQSPAPRGLTQKWKGKEKEKITANHPKSLHDEDYAILICLAVSDHTLWSDSDLRRTIERNADRFVPLSYLLRHSSILTMAGLGRNLLAEEMSIVKALKAHAGDILEIRMLISEPSGDLGWQAKQDPGLYELRRRDWERMLKEPSRLYPRAEWERRTIYLENIPLQNRFVSGIARLTLSLLPQSEGDSSLLIRVQNITLPPHHQDAPGDIPKCKGFALVTLANPEDVETLLREWPWDVTPNKYDKPSSSHHQEATKFGLRALSKGRWDQLKDEYLTHQRQLLDELVAFNNGLSNYPPAEDDLDMPEAVEHHKPAPSPAAGNIITVDSPYPLCCLVFVRNVHPETNKTTLRKLFCGAFDATLAQSLDYVDFVKGADSCYLRFTSARSAEILVDHFTSHLTKQEGGLDDIGTAGTTKDSIAAEIVQGKKEEVYWEKVPEKVRWKAVQMAVSAQESNTKVSRMEDVVEEKAPAEGAHGSNNAKRKKRKRDQ